MTRRSSCGSDSTGPTRAAHPEGRRERQARVESDRIDVAAPSSSDRIQYKRDGPPAIGPPGTVVMFSKVNMPATAFARRRLRGSRMGCCQPLAQPGRPPDWDGRCPSVRRLPDSSGNGPAGRANRDREDSGWHSNSAARPAGRSSHGTFIRPESCRRTGAGDPETGRIPLHFRRLKSLRGMRTSDTTSRRAVDRPSW